MTMGCYAEVVDYCRRHIDEYDYMPSAVAVSAALGIHYTTAYRHIKRAIDMGRFPVRITRRQADVLRYYRAYIQAHGQSPTLDEAAAGVGTDRTYVNACLQVLVAAGLLAYHPRRYARAIVLPGTDERSAA